MDGYFRRVEASVDRTYDVATKARARGIDPEPIPEVPRAQDMAGRVEQLLAHLGIQGISEEIRRLAATMSREDVAVAIVRRIALDPRRTGTLAERVEAALRVGLAILTEGILVAPLEGLAEVHLRPTSDGSQYIELYYAGPIRAAGGTAQALSVLLADIVRHDLGLAAFRAEPAEVERYKEEIPLYKYHQHLQYIPSAAEIELVVRHVPVCISGESTEGRAEVSGFRNLPRVETNGIRGGACLVIAEGLCQKAAKLRKIVDRLGLSGWEFLSQLGHSRSADESTLPKYLSEAVGGRPILAHPNRPGGFRLVYGRSRTTGLAGCAVSPATMVVLRNFVAVGTQVKLEYPGKATAMGVCDLLEGPIVALDDGSLVAIHDPERAREFLPHIRRVVDLGELLVSVGEFLENNHALVPGAYTRDWHLEELRAAGAPIDPEGADPASYADATEIGRRWNVPLHPRWNLFWHDLTPSEIRALGEFVERSGHWRAGRLELPAGPVWQELLARLGFLHQSGPEGLVVGEVDASWALVGPLGLLPQGDGLERVAPLDPSDLDPLAYVSRLAGLTIRARAPSRVGARVGRPEKAYARKMKPNVHALFPVGEAGGSSRSVLEAVRRTVRSGVSVQLGERSCPDCQRRTVWAGCACGGHTTATGRVTAHPLPVAQIWGDAIAQLGLTKATSPPVKGVKGLTSTGKTPERIEKGILRALHGISVYQDGTARFDLSDLPLTHFRPREIGTDLATLARLGYERDWRGEPLLDPEQVVELFPQDVIVPRSCGDYLVHLAAFLDDELARLYGLEPFYRAERPEELVGEVVVALAPHTSGGVAARIIGYTEAEACFASPLLHAAKRRNCDGDEDSVTLLLDALLNFSRAFLPNSRGALMDKPLVLTTRLNPIEIDKEAHNVDVGLGYPLAVYRAALARRDPKEVEPLLDTIGSRLAAGRALSGYGFTHDTSDIAGGPVRSAYRDEGSMDEKVEASFLLAEQIRAVDVGEATTVLLTGHLLQDLAGNLRAFATQQFRCDVCNVSYRRPPLTGRCSRPASGRGGRCNTRLKPTLHEASVRKYLALAERLASTESVSPYVRQRVQVLADVLAAFFPARSQKRLEAFTADTPDGAPPTAPTERTNRDRSLSPTGGLVG